MKTGRTWLVYTLIRVGIFAVVLAVLLVTQMTPWIAAALAAVISLCISYIFLRKPRQELANGLYEARNSTKEPKRAPEKAGSDEDLEDTVVDGSAVDGSAVDSSVADSIRAEPDATGVPENGIEHRS